MKARIDPNKIERYQALITQYYLEGNVLDERRIFGNGCLQKLSPGVGSSLKPIVYDAVTAAYNFNWDQLFLTPPIVGSDVLSPSDGRHRILYNYAGKAMDNGKPNSGWNFLDGDRNFEDCTSKQYLPRSSNVYHSLIMFIGSFEKDALRKQQFLKPTTQLGLTSRFPQIQYGTTLYGFSEWSKNFSSANSLLANGLYSNYDLPLFFTHVGDSARAMQSNLMKGYDDAFFKETKSSHKLWSFPEYSMFSQVDRARNPAIEGLRQSTVGGFPVEITPLKMAEMSGKMVSANPAYRATVVQKVGKKAIGKLIVAESWGSGAAGEQAFLNFKSNTILSSMHTMATSKDKNVSTGSSITAAIDKINQDDGKTFHFYGKTGTINSPYAMPHHTEQVDNRLFMLIISKTKLHDRNDLTREILQNNKFYVLYFSFQRSQKDSQIGALIAKQLGNVMESAAFKNYMK